RAGRRRRRTRRRRPARSCGSSDVEILDEPLVFAVACDTKCAGHELADDGRYMIPMLVVGHAVGRLAVIDDEIDDRTRSVEIAVIGAGDLDIELLFNIGKELVEGPAHSWMRSVSVSRRSQCRGARTVEQRGVAGLLRVYLLLVSFGPAMTSARKSASRTGLPGPRVPDPIGTAADAPHGSRPEQVYSRLR